MADEEKSFEELLKAAPGGGTVSLVGTLAQSSERARAAPMGNDDRSDVLRRNRWLKHVRIGRKNSRQHANGGIA